ncbi:MAG: DUF1538 domain-containing protein [Gammaproteobacteria bacterium]|nr:DUF1538 domain-containing protein [Gammaproteobacteria bacterium]MYD79284.1 DUF1538 domain-containing protein [Gammaproteobacteria bacterium]
MSLLLDLANSLGSTLRDVVPIVVILVVFQVLVLRQRLPRLKQIITGFVLVVLGLSLFLVGLNDALFPIGETMAAQLTSSSGATNVDQVRWMDYMMVYAFAAAIGFATAVAEPALIAVSMKAQTASGGTIDAWGLRIAVAFGAAIGVSLGCFRIVTGTPLQWYIMGIYIVVMILTIFSNRTIMPLAYDSGGVTTSTVTVPVVAALGLGLASNVPGRSPLVDGFGLIAFTCAFPIMTVLGYSLIVSRLGKKKNDQPGLEE